ncbi:MAG: hypothetical protein AAF725_12365 [Acidobacteriota bacterium]
MSQNTSSARQILAILALVLLCGAPAAYAADEAAPTSVFDVLEQVFAELGDWIGALIDDPSNHVAEEQSGEEDSDISNITPDIEPVG